MLHRTQCILDELSGYFAGGPQEKFYRIFTAMMNISADVSMKSFDSRRKVENMLQISL